MGQRREEVMMDLLPEVAAKWLALDERAVSDMSG